MSSTDTIASHNPPLVSRHSTWRTRRASILIFIPSHALLFQAVLLVLSFLSSQVCRTSHLSESLHANLILYKAPFELLKLKSQLAGKMARDGPSAASIRTMPTSDIKTGTWGPAYQMYKDHGWTSLWRGGSLHLGMLLFFLLNNLTFILADHTLNSSRYSRHCNLF